MLAGGSPGTPGTPGTFAWGTRGTPGMFAGGIPGTPGMITGFNYTKSKRCKLRISTLKSKIILCYFLSPTFPYLLPQ
jgi:hypothetical protein